ncbi:hypothetical protein M5689_021144 [Euphorbia peplus]|nr:hypothetical protein M5689_021144 [Euphorbia peplus]
MNYIGYEITNDFKVPTLPATNSTGSLCEEESIFYVDFTSPLLPLFSQLFHGVFSGERLLKERATTANKDLLLQVVAALGYTVIGLVGVMYTYSPL